MDVVDFHSNIATVFDKKYKTNKDFKQRFSVWISILDKYIQDRSSGYDIGCGSGVLSIYLASKGIQMTGFDGANGMLEVARQNAASIGIESAIFQKEVIPFPISGLKKADIIISSSVLEYIEQLDETFKMLSELLNKDGILVVSLPNSNSYYRKIEKLAYTLFGKPSYFSLVKHLTTPDSLEKIASKYGLKPIEKKYFGNTFLLSRLFSYFLPEKFYSNLFLIVFKKA